MMIEQYCVTAAVADGKNVIIIILSYDDDDSDSNSWLVGMDDHAQCQQQLHQYFVSPPIRYKADFYHADFIIIIIIIIIWCKE
jgi:hypothetical protein